MKTIILQILFLSLYFSIQAQDVIVNDAELPEAEFHVAVNPTDTNNIILATIHGFFNPNGNNITIYSTHDFGNTWQISDFHGAPEDYAGAGDPVVTFDDEGNALLINLSLETSSQEAHSVLSKSVDGGVTWTLASVLVAGDSDKPWMATDIFESSPYKGNTYIPVVENEINLYTLNSNNETTNVATLPNGFGLPSVVVKKNGDVFTSTLSFSFSGNSVFVQQYTQGGTNLVHSTSAVTFPDYTFNMPNISERFQPTAYLAIDNSGGDYDGRLYLSYTASESINPNFFDVFLTYSDDDGENWSTPKVVHSNQESEVQQFYSSIYINQQGVLVMDWYDRGNYDNSNLQTDFYFGVSYDGGETFTEVQLNTASSDFDQVIPSSNNFGIGEYHQLVATDNTAISFWSDGRTNDGDLNIYMAKVSLQNVVAVEEINTLTNTIAVSALYPQPIRKQVNLDIKLLESIGLMFDVIDNNGKKVWTKKVENYQTGTHTVAIPCDIPAGVYYVRVVSDRGGFIKTMKLIKQ